MKTHYERMIAMVVVIGLCLLGWHGLAEAQEPDELRVFRPAAQLNPEKDPILLEIQKRTNTKIEIVTAPWDQVWNKLNMIMASGESIDLIQADNGASPWVQWAKEGLMYDLAELVDKDKHPFIYASINSEMYKDLKVDGKSYFMAATHHGPDWSVYMRTDWLKKLEMDMPTTTEELYTLLKAFKDNEMGGPGTVGYEAYLKSPDNYEPFLPLLHVAGGNGEMTNVRDLAADENGNVRWMMLEEGTKNGLKFINRLYREGIINSDFASLKDQPEAHGKYLYAGKAGMVYDPQPVVTLANVQQVDPDAEFGFVPPITGDGTFEPLVGGPQYWLLIGIPKTSKNPDAAMRFLEYVNSKEGRILIVAGIQGRHYTKLTEDGVYTQNREAWRQDYDIKQYGWDFPMWWGFFGTTHGYVPVEEYPAWEEAFANEVLLLSDTQAEQLFNVKTQVAHNASWTKFNPLQGPPVPEDVASIFIKIHSDVKARYWLKMIIEPDPEKLDGLWDEFIKAAKRTGSDKVIAAYQKLYDEKMDR